MINTRKSILIFCIACMFAFVSVFLQVSPISTSNYIKESFHFNSAEIANLSAFYFLAYAIFQIPNGILLDKFGIKKLLPIGVFIVLIGNCLYLTSNDAFLIGSSRFMIGLGCSIAYIGAVFIAARLFQPKFLPLCIAIVEIVSTMGAIVAENTYRSIVLHLGWNIANLIIITLTLIILLVSLMALRDVSFESRHHYDDIKWSSLFLRVQSLLRNKLLLAIFVYSFFSWGLIMGFAGYWAKKYFEHVHHFTALVSLDFAELYWLSFLVSALFISFLAKSEKRIKILIVVLASIGAISLVLMSIPVLSNDFELILFSIFSGLSASGVILAFSLIPYCVNEKVIGVAMALNNTFVVLGGFFVQVAFGAVIYIPIHYGKLWIAQSTSLSYYNGILLLMLFSIGALAAIVIALCQKKKAVMFS